MLFFILYVGAFWILLLGSFLPPPPSPPPSPFLLLYIECVGFQAVFLKKVYCKRKSLFFFCHKCCWRWLIDELFALCWVCCSWLFVEHLNSCPLLLVDSLQVEDQQIIVVHVCCCWKWSECSFTTHVERFLGVHTLHQIFHVAVACVVPPRHPQPGLADSYAKMLTMSSMLCVTPPELC